MKENILSEMISLKEFENLIARPESSILDFKTSMYDFNEDIDSTAKFIKDVVSFCNTVRNETSYIIIGIEEKDNKEKLLYGLNRDIDDSVLQQKVMQKVHPSPKFNYYTIPYQNKKFGILEFPKTKYSSPIYPTVKLKGLEIGKVYYRQGTSNAEALAMEVIKINEWLQSLPDFEQSSSINDEINKLIKELTSGDKKLSLLIADIYSIAQKYKLNDLMLFCSNELHGFTNKTVVNEENGVLYRAQDAYISIHKVQVNPYHQSHSIRQEFEKNKDFIKTKLIFSQSIVNLEEIYSQIGSTIDGIGTLTMNSNDLLGPKVGNYTVYGYFFKDTILNLYTNIRQEAIDRLMIVNKSIIN